MDLFAILTTSIIIHNNSFKFYNTTRVKDNIMVY